MGILILAWLTACSDPTPSQLPGLPEAAGEVAKRWAVQFDFDTDSCLPAPAIAPDGRINGGLDDSGSITGECRESAQLEQANTYYRSATVTHDDATFTVHMYALYFEKDQAVPNVPLGSHRHDWEYVLLWTTDDALTHAAFSAHGKVPPVAKDDLHLGDNGRVRAVYHKHNVRTHALRGAKEGESAENARGWLTPPLVEWDRLSASLQAKLEGHDFGAAHCPFTNGRFPVELAKSPPPGYPGGDAWAQALR